jgi:lysozyme
MNCSDKALDIIKSFESLRLDAYMPTPNDVPTIGYGSTRGVTMGDTCTESEALQMLKEDVSEAEGCVSMAVDVDLTQHQFDALVSLVFNIGCGAFRGSTLLKLLNAGDYAAAQQQFGRWNKQAGKVLNGLTRRREAEAALFAA